MSIERTKVLMLYGPPAVGKLSVAQDISGKTGYKVLHNHLTTDLVTAVFDFEDPQTEELTLRFRTQMLEAACKAEIPGVICTAVYVHPQGTNFMRRVIDAVENNNGVIYLVQLISAKHELLKRIQERSRLKFNKLHEPDKLMRELANRDYLSPIEGRRSLIIDNTDLPLGEVSEHIIDHYNLRRV